MEFAIALVLIFRRVLNVNYFFYQINYPFFVILTDNRITPDKRPGGVGKIKN